MGGGSFPPNHRTLAQPPSALLRLSRRPQTGLAACLLCFIVFSLQLTPHESTMKHREVKASKVQMPVLVTLGLVAARALGSPSGAAPSLDQCIANRALFSLQRPAVAEARDGVKSLHSRPRAQRSSRRPSW